MTVLSDFVEAIGQSAIGPYHPLSKAAGVADGFAGKLALALALRNMKPDEARERLVASLASWPVLCRVMAELEQAYPEEAGEAAIAAAPMLAMLDRRDRRGEHA